MNLYQACVRLDIWPTVKVYVEVWFSNNPNSESLQELKDLAKQSYRNLSMHYHPDKGGDHDNYLEIQEAFNKVKESNIKEFINVLKEEQESQIQYFKPGSNECNKCSRWSDIVNICITVTCSGYQEPTKPRFVNIDNKFVTAKTTIKQG